MSPETMTPERIQYYRQGDAFPLTQEALRTLKEADLYNGDAISVLRANLTTIRAQDELLLHFMCQRAEAYSEVAKDDQTLYQVDAYYDFISGATETYDLLRRSALSHSSDLPQISPVVFKKMPTASPKDIVKYGSTESIKNHDDMLIREYCGDEFIELVRQKGSVMYATGANLTAHLLVGEIDSYRNG